MTESAERVSFQTPGFGLAAEKAFQIPRTQEEVGRFLIEHASPVSRPRVGDAPVRTRMASDDGDLRIKANWHMSNATDGGGGLRLIWRFVRYWLPAAALAILYGALKAFFS